MDAPKPAVGEAARQGSPIAPGEIVAGKYRIESVLGRGGMGVVVAATHVHLDQRVAIKFLIEERADPQMRERFAREARAASKIRSEHVAHVSDVGALDSGIPYIVMEYLAGEDLARRLRTRGALPVVDAVGYVLQACEALAEAHAAGIVHRDLKPANMFLARRADGSLTVKVLDFGISKTGVQGGDGGITGGTAILGSPTYMAPEQIRSPRDVNLRGDIWSLGVVLFELVVGSPPFRAETFPELCARIIEQQAPDLANLVPGAPPGLGAVVNHCLEKNPSARFASLAELAAALEPFGPAEGRISVQRVGRILGGAGSADGPLSSPAGMLEFQDAATVKARDELRSGPPEDGSAREKADGNQTAHSVVSTTPRKRKGEPWIGVAAGLLVLGGIVTTFVARRDGAASHEVATPVPSVSQAADLVVTSAAVPRAEIEERAEHATMASDWLSAAPPVDAGAEVVGASLRRGSGGRGMAPAKAKAKPPAPAAPVSATAADSMAGTEGFGDRK